MTLCLHYQGYGHTAKTCKCKRICGFCAKDHDTRGCPTSEAPSTFSCINCKGNHVTWSPLCPERAARSGKAGAAYAARPNKYTISAKLTSAHQILLLLLPPLATLPQLSSSFPLPNPLVCCAIQHRSMAKECAPTAILMLRAYRKNSAPLHPPQSPLPPTQPRPLAPSQPQHYYLFPMPNHAYVLIPLAS